MAVQGVFEAIDHYHGVGWVIKGWAFDPAAPQRPVELALCTQDKAIAHFAADRPRPDLAAAGLGSGHCAFELPVPPSLLNGQPFRLQIAVLSEQRWLPKTALDWFSAELVGGKLTSLEQRRLNGWAVANTPGRPPQLDISIDGQWVASIGCDLERPDLQLDMAGRQAAGFGWNLPDRFQDGQPHRLSVQLANLGTELVGSPLEFCLQAARGTTRQRVLAAEAEQRRAELKALEEELAREPPYQLSDPAAYAAWLPQHEQQLQLQIQQPLQKQRKQPLPRVVLKPLADTSVESLTRWLRRCQADAVGFVGARDTVHPLWAQAAAQTLRERRCLALYCDEDQRGRRGPAQAPFFKPDWDPERHRAQGYVGLACVVRSELLRAALAQLPAAARQWPVERWVAALLDLALLPLQRAQVQHLPYVLYHRGQPWKALLPAKLRAALLQPALQALGSKASIELLPGERLRLHYALPEPAPEVVLLIPTRDRVDLLKTCVDSILRLTDYPHYRILIIDNDSAEPATLAWLREIVRHPQVETRRWPGAFNYAAMHNEVIATLDAPYIALLNNDIEVLQADWLRAMLQLAQQDDVGAVGAKLLYPNGLVQHGGVIIGLREVAENAQRSFAGDEDGYFGSLQVVQQFSAVTGACLLCLRSDYLAVGGMDAENLPVSFNDVDLCLKLGQAGKRILWTPHATLYHHESATRGRQGPPAQRAREEAEARYLVQKWRIRGFEDPCYSRNLSLREQSHVDFR